MSNNFQFIWIILNKIKKLSWKTIWNWEIPYVTNNIKKYFYWWKTYNWKNIKTYDCILYHYNTVYHLYCKNKKNKIEFITKWSYLSKIFNDYFNILLKNNLKNI